MFPMQSSSRMGVCMWNAVKTSILLIKVYVMSLSFTTCVVFSGLFPWRGKFIRIYSSRSSFCSLYRTSISSTFLSVLLQDPQCGFCHNMSILHFSICIIFWFPCIFWWGFLTRKGCPLRVHVFTFLACNHVTLDIISSSSCLFSASLSTFSIDCVF